MHLVHVKVKKVTLAEEHMRQIQSIGGMMCLLEGIMGVLEKMEVAEEQRHFIDA